ncbi:MAG: hypothetical protein JRJ04_14495 [Deltaproteobacteria bacterium]|nr:hypothetical protein [Deltaproteobacteria bacterium]
MKAEQTKPVIVLDAGGVMVEFDLNLIFKKLARRFGVRVDAAAPVDLNALFHPLEVGKQPWDIIPPALNQSLGLSLDSEQWRDLCTGIFTGEVPGMRETLSCLKSGFMLIALSNTIEVHWKYLIKKYPIFKLLDGWVVSYQEGVVKPDPAIYRAVSDRYCGGHPPFYFTDDTPENVEAAIRLGWEAEIFRDAPSFRKEIKRRL